MARTMRPHLVMMDYACRNNLSLIACRFIIIPPKIAAQFCINAGLIDELYQIEVIKLELLLQEVEDVSFLFPIPLILFWLV